MNIVESHREVCRQCYRRGFVAGDCPMCQGWGVIVIRTLAKDYGKPTGPAPAAEE